ncbi:MAG TPA: hypothetical protein VL860_00090 [Planctomycetota bacterium]|nr:hypothetical protein [Planctomycetota bacterium]
MKTTDASESRQLQSLRSSLAAIDREDMETNPQGIVYQMLSRYAHSPRLLAQLAVTDPDLEICSGALLILFLALKDSQIPESFQDRVRTEAGGILERALRDPQTSDDRKFMLGPAAFLCEIHMSEEEYRGLFKDFESISARKFKEYADGILDNPAAIDKVLISADLVAPPAGAAAETAKGEPAGKSTAPPDDDPPEVVTPKMLETELHRAGALCQHNPAVGATLMILTMAAGKSLGVDAPEWEKYLEFAARADSGRAAWYLTELGRMPGLGDLAVAAAKLGSQLKQTGVRARCPVAGDYSHGWVSQMDGAGSRSLNLYFRTPEGGMDGLTLLLNDETGMKEIFCVFGEGASLEEEVQKRSGRVAFAPCSLALARALIGDAVGLHRAQNKPLPGRFLLFRYLLGPEPLAVQPHEAKLGCYLLETVVFSPELIADSASLADSPLYGPLWCNSEVAYDYLTEQLEEEASKGKKRRTKRLKLKKPALTEYIREVCIKDRERLQKRLAANLEFEGWRGRARRPENRSAALVWLALARDLVPFEEIPYVRELAKHGAENISENIYYGYKSQAEVEIASLMEVEDEEDFANPDDAIGER